MDKTQAPSPQKQKKTSRFQIQLEYMKPPAPNLKHYSRLCQYTIIIITPQNGENAVD